MRSISHHIPHDSARNPRQSRSNPNARSTLKLASTATVATLEFLNKILRNFKKQLRERLCRLFCNLNEIPRCSNRKKVSFTCTWSEMVQKAINLDPAAEPLRFTIA
ncbi:MAG: hypothetical protein JWO73_102 [Candidatus Taylorbacteria bacterium]|nr:hypothetical protein [Candidatus Taylorbacteria bacterium]